MKLSTDIQTYTGKYFDYDNFGPDDISEIDVAKALNQICRFNGHCTEHYPVAKHLCLVHDLMDYNVIIDSRITREYVFHGLIHDVGEAYLTDIPRPLKNYFAALPEFGEFMKNYIILEDKIIDMFALKFGHTKHTNINANVVKYYDNWALRIEQKHIMCNTPRKWDNESLSFPDDPPFVQKYFKKRFFKVNYAKEFLRRLEYYK